MYAFDNISSDLVSSIFLTKYVVTSFYHVLHTRVKKIIHKTALKAQRPNIFNMIGNVVIFIKKRTYNRSGFQGIFDRHGKLGRYRRRWKGLDTFNSSNNIFIQQAVT